MKPFSPYKKTKSKPATPKATASDAADVSRSERASGGGGGGGSHAALAGGRTLALRNDGLDRSIVISLGLHVAVFVVLTVRAVFYPTQPILDESPIHVDIVALPDKPAAKLPPIEEAPPPKPVEEPKPEVKPEPKPPEPVAAKPAPLPPKPESPKVNLDRSKRDQAEALKRLEALDKVQRMMKEQSKPDVVKAAAPPPPQPIKGNEVSPGTAIRGLAKLDYENYKQALRDHVHRFWNLPRWMTSANLKTAVQIYVDSSGNVLKKVLTRPSKTPAFDERVMKAIESAAPVPKPPSELANVLAVDGIEIEFAPEE